MKYTIIAITLLVSFALSPQISLGANSNQSDDPYQEYKKERDEKNNNVKSVNKSYGRALAQTYFTTDRKALVKKKALRKTASEDLSVKTKKKKPTKSKKKPKNLPKKKNKAKKKKKKASTP